LPNISFAQLIKQVDTVQCACIRDEVKLRRSGELIYFISEQILDKANALLEKSQQTEVDEIDTKIDRSFSDFIKSLTQQSISTNFMLEYLQPQPKADYQRETTRSIKFLSAQEALEELAQDLIEQGSVVGFPDHTQVLLKSEIFTLAHDENIEVWIESVERHLKLHPKVNTLPKIAKLNDLTLAQAFVAALFGNFKIKQIGDFYEVNQLKLFR
jgi:chromatin segregation and condensation protein Rec8/ScpA/Scc1 (kleisin family)